jgi:hypothetical protein
LTAPLNILLTSTHTALGIVCFAAAGEEMTTTCRRGINSDCALFCKCEQQALSMEMIAILYKRMPTSLRLALTEAISGRISPQTG